MKEFSARVIKIALSIPPGKVRTYGSIARAAGGGGQAARSVTAILAKAYHAGQKDIPFHRIVYANGVIFSDASFDVKRRKLFKQEGIEVDAKGKIKNFRDISM